MFVCFLSWMITLLISLGQFCFIIFIIRHGIHYVCWPFYEHLLFPFNLYVIIEVLYMLRFIGDAQRLKFFNEIYS